MRAVVQDRYGPPDVLRIAEVPTPEPGPGQVLVRVVATSVNLSDWECLVGRPAYARIRGLRRPGWQSLGSDIAGIVEAIGPDVVGMEPGDAVIGDNLDAKGGFAEYALIPARALGPKPSGLPFVDASAIPQSGAIAFQGMRRADLDTTVLINGGGGGSGSLAIQLAKAAGAHVTAVDNAGKLDFMRDVGADAVIDYERDDFTSGPARYDLILDLVAHGSVFAYRRALAPGGHYLCVGGSVPTLLRVVTIGALAGRVTGRRMALLAVREGPEHFAPVVDLWTEGELDIDVDRTFALEETAAALRHVGEGRALGKVVVHVDPTRP